jgi:hypothetical protein
MLIGLCGFSGSGKDSLATHLVSTRGFIKLSFAGILKDVICTIFDYDREMMEGCTPASREWREQVDTWWASRLRIPHLTPRWLMQHIGTNVFRDAFHTDIWVAALERKLLKYKNVVVTDCRFPNEIELLKRLGGCMIRVNRGEPPSSFVHPSEWAWVSCGPMYTIDNNGTLEDAYKKIDRYLIGT